MGVVEVSKMFELPEIPPIGTILIDKAEDEWRVYSEAHLSMMRGGTIMVWGAALQTYGPMRVKPRPARRWAIDLPEEPDVGTKVEDRDGDVWTRVSGDVKGWAFREETRPSFTWENIYGSYAPLTEIFPGDETT